MWKAKVKEKKLISYLMAEHSERDCYDMEVDISVMFYLHYNKSRCDIVSFSHLENPL